jgi:hypothetical protein
VNSTGRIHIQNAPVGWDLTTSRSRPWQSDGTPHRAVAALQQAGGQAVWTAFAVRRPCAKPITVPPTAMAVVAIAAMTSA